MATEVCAARRLGWRQVRHFSVCSTQELPWVHERRDAVQDSHDSVSDVSDVSDVWGEEFACGMLRPNC